MPANPDYAAMTDRELDRAIAERVFGRDPLNARVGLHPADGDVEYHWGYPVGHDIAPHYSTDPAAMMQVVDAMRLLRGFNLLITSPTRQVAHWGATFFEDTDDGVSATEWSGGANTLPRAICLAALAAVEAAQPEAAG